MMPKSVERFSDDSMLLFVGMDHVHEFEPLRPKPIVIWEHHP